MRYHTIDMEPDASLPDLAKLESAFMSRSRLRVWDAARQAYTISDRGLIAMLLRQLKEGRRPFHRAAAAYALGNIHSKRAVPGLEAVLANRKENPLVRGQAAETLASLSANRSIPVLTKCLRDPSKHVRFWCAYSLGVAGSLNKRKAAVALPTLRKVAASDRRTVPGFWSVADECQWATLRLEEREKEARQLELSLERLLFPPKPSRRNRKTQKSH
jgi:HEAT repeat protein